MKLRLNNFYFLLLILLALGMQAQSNRTLFLEPSTEQAILPITPQLVMQRAQTALKKYIACLRGETSCSQEEINKARRQAVFLVTIATLLGFKLVDFLLNTSFWPKKAPQEPAPRSPSSIPAEAALTLNIDEEEEGEEGEEDMAKLKEKEERKKGDGEEEGELGTKRKPRLKKLTAEEKEELEEKEERKKGSKEEEPRLTAPPS